MSDYEDIYNEIEQIRTGERSTKTTTKTEWITDRRPTKADANYDGDVLHSDNGDVFLYQWSALKDGEPWMPLPKPYQPPPDTSLAASIERYDEYLRFGSEDYSEIDNDFARIIEAARKWDEYISNAAVQAPNDDHDGVGAGWRLLREKELIVSTDGLAADGVDLSKESVWVNGISQSDIIGTTPLDHPGYVFRRRIDADNKSQDSHSGDRSIREGCCPSRNHEGPATGDRLVIGVDAGKRYEARTSKRVRRVFRKVSHVQHEMDDGTHGDSLEDDPTLIEVLPDDPSPEWVERLIELCEKMTDCRQNHQTYWHWADEIGKHLKKRGEK